VTLAATNDGKAEASVIFDCHLHVIDPGRFPFKPGVGYTPKPDESGSREAMKATLDGADVRGALIVQPSCYGFDNSALLDALAAEPGRHRGIAVIAGSETDAELQRLAEAGVVGIRFNLASFDGGALARPEAARLLERIKALDWFAQVHGRDQQWAEAAPALQRSQVKVVVDHFGIGDAASGIAAPGFQAVLGLGRTGRAAVKLSAPFRLAAAGDGYAALDGHVESLLEAFGGERCVWGSDWPFLALDRRPDYRSCLAFLQRWLPDRADRDLVMHRNPSLLFGFEA
jgi:predicted TIM-barrel fold metal-dependent hydrolase